MTLANVVNRPSNKATAVYKLLTSRTLHATEPIPFEANMTEDALDRLILAWAAEANEAKTEGISKPLR